MNRIVHDPLQCPAPNAGRPNNRHFRVPGLKFGEALPMTKTTPMEMKERPTWTVMLDDEILVVKSISVDADRTSSVSFLDITTLES